LIFLICITKKHTAIAINNSAKNPSFENIHFSLIHVD
jgi:hypothetical protein